MSLLELEWMERPQEVETCILSFPGKSYPGQPNQDCLNCHAQQQALAERFGGFTIKLSFLCSLLMFNTHSVVLWNVIKVVGSCLKAGSKPVTIVHLLTC